MCLFLVTPNHKTAQEQQVGQVKFHKQFIETTILNLLKTIGHENLENVFEVFAWVYFDYESVFLEKFFEKDSNKNHKCLPVSKTSYENTFPSSEDISQNITNSANILWSKRQLMRTDNN